MTELIFTKIQRNGELTGLAQMIPDVVFSRAGGVELKMRLLVPQASLKIDNGKTYPCIVFVQGSGWTFPDVNYETPQLSAFAQKGYVVAQVTHRNSMDGYKAPAFVEDVKTAIRFLRAHAEEYRIDKERIGIWGTSSGGNTALLVGLTGDNPVYKTKEYEDESDAVRTVVDCFGPADLDLCFEQTGEALEADSLQAALFGTDPEEILHRKSLINPVTLIRENTDYPPFLLLHGTGDSLVPYSQSEEMAGILCEHNVHTEMVAVEGAEHEGDFWSQELLDLIGDYLERTL